MTIGRLLMVGVVLVLLLGTGVVLTDVFVMPWLVHRQAEVLVPDLAGLTVEEATRSAERLGLRLVVGEEAFHAEAEPGVVLEQFPPSLRSVRAGRPVRVVVSKGEALARVPDLTGLSLRQSELVLVREGLRIGRVARSYDPRGAVGVIAQRPRAGVEVPGGTAVELLLREGTERVFHRMPRLVGRSLVRVREELGGAGFELRRVTYRPDDERFPGTILEQWPPEGSRLPLGGSIELVASSRS